MNHFPLYLELESNYQGTILMYYSFLKVIVKFCGLQYAKGFIFYCNPQNLTFIKNLTLQMCLVHRSPTFSKISALEQDYIKSYFQKTKIVKI